MALNALHNLHRSLTAAMTLATEVCSPRVPATPFTIEFFLCGLYLRDRDAVIAYFETEEPYIRMVKELCGDHAKRSLLRKLSSRRGPVSIFTNVDESFVDVLCQAAEVSLAGGRRRIELRDFMRALGSKQDIVRKLSENRGLTLKKVV